MSPWNIVLQNKYCVIDKYQFFIQSIFWWLQEIEPSKLDANKRCCLQINGLYSLIRRKWYLFVCFIKMKYVTWKEAVKCWQVDKYIWFVPLLSFWLTRTCSHMKRKPLNIKVSKRWFEPYFFKSKCDFHGPRTTQW